MIVAFKQMGLPTYILRPQDFEKGDNSHKQTPTGKEKLIGRCKKVISAKDYKALSENVKWIKSRIENRSEWWIKTTLSEIDSELATIMDAIDGLREIEKFIESHGVIIEVNESKDLLNHPE